MTEFLVKKFIKNWEQIEDASVRTSYGIFASITGVICNVLLFLGKLAVGIALNSISVMADAFNNLSDAASSVIGYAGIKMADKPADDAHPFGHGRIEYIAALIVAFLVIEVGFTFLKSSVGKIRNPETISFQLVSVIILIGSIGVKLWMAYFNRKLGVRINSKVMMATAADALGDVFTTTATILSILVYRFFDVNIDGFVGVAVALIVMWAGINIAKDTLEPLIGEAATPEVYQKITEFVESYEGIAGSHDLIVHNYGPVKSLASIHAEVPNDVAIEESHEIIDRIEKEAARKLGIILVIHMDPIEMKDGKVSELKQMTIGAIAGIDSRLSIHDFRIVDGISQISLIFDLIIPHEYQMEKQAELQAEIEEKINRIDSRCHCVISMEKSYINGNR